MLHILIYTLLHSRIFTFHFYLLFIYIRTIFTYMYLKKKKNRSSLKFKVTRNATESREQGRTSSRGKKEWSHRRICQPKESKFIVVAWYNTRLSRYQFESNSPANNERVERERQRRARRNAHARSGWNHAIRTIPSTSRRPNVASNLHSMRRGSRVIRDWIFHRRRNRGLCFTDERSVICFPSLSFSVGSSIIHGIFTVIEARPSAGKETARTRRKRMPACD